MGIAVFLDRDGILNVERKDYVKSWEEFQWLPGAQEAVALLNSCSIPVYLITNQSVVGRGIISIEKLKDIHSRLENELLNNDAHFDGIYVCPHAPEMGCTCRKPEPGLLLQAIYEHNLTHSDVWFIGDSKTDYLAGKRAGVHTILINSDKNILNQSNEIKPDYTFKSLLEAVEFLIKNHLPQRRKGAEKIDSLNE